MGVVSPQLRGLCKETMTTDEATKSEGEVQAAALTEHGEDITPTRDRGVLKVRGAARRVLPFLLHSGDHSHIGGLHLQPLGSCSTSRAVGLVSSLQRAKEGSITCNKEGWSGI